MLSLFIFGVNKTENAIKLAIQLLQLYHCREDEHVLH